MCVPRKVMMDIASKIILSGNNVKRDILDTMMKTHGGDIQTDMIAAMDEYATVFGKEIVDELERKRDNCYDFQSLNIKKLLK